MQQTLTRDQLKVRMLRGVSGLSQEEYERVTDVDSIAHIERGLRQPSAGQIAQMCFSLNLTPEDCEKMFRIYETRTTASATAKTTAARKAHEQEFVSREIYRLNLEAIVSDWDAIRQRRPVRSVLRTAELERAGESWQLLSELSTFEDMTVATRVGRDFQTWPMVELLCRESLDELPVTVERALGLAELAVEAARLVRAPVGWRCRLMGYALMHLARVHRGAGNSEVATVLAAEARRLWDVGDDPDQLLKPALFNSLEAAATAE